MSRVVIAEKPSVARDIAAVLGAKQRRNGYFVGKGYTVTWALGHLVALAEPAEINPKWRAWRRELLPMLPKQWPLSVLKSTQSQYQTVEQILTDPSIEDVVCATDAGREGELIFRYVYEKAGCKKPIFRLWISSLTPAAIKKGMANLKQGQAFDPLAAAARGRSQADWLVGMNLSRAYTLIQNQTLTVGRVQTPTLAMLVERTREIENFVPEDYKEVVAKFATPTGTYLGVFQNEKKSTHIDATTDEAERIAERAAVGAVHVDQIKKEKKRRPPPLLYDLTELQRHANRLFGFSAKKTLQLAQQLYERHKLISYPRTDSRYLSKDVADTLDEIVDAIRTPYEPKLAPGTGQKPLGRRFVNDAKVTDHHAIIPTGQSSDRLPPGSDEMKIYDLVCRRLLMAWHKDHVASVTTVMTHISTPADGETVVDRYRGSGTLVEDDGWKVLDPPSKNKKKKGTTEGYRDQAFPPGLTEGDHPSVESTEILKKRTKPPKAYTEATLLTAMESAGKAVEDKALSEAMKENGLGTPATRAAIIENLLQREYVMRQKKILAATDKGKHLIDMVHEHVKSPAMTGQWEHRLKEIERGKESLETFMADIETFVSQVVGSVGQHGRPPIPPSRSTVQISPVSSPTQRTVAPSSRAVPDMPAHLADVPPPEDDGFGADPVPMRGAASVSSINPAPQPRRAQSNLSPVTPPQSRIKRQTGETLDALLKRAFGFPGFRPHQEAVCQTVTTGKSVLLVMPTGAGKSLCYQLPGVARGGTTVVVSPLIALMDDQTASLQSYGFAAERIHSGLMREEARQVCRRYLNGDLDFLFIAPERLGVPGFPEMLAKRMPVLIAVDEAHCISHWGHDFRPDYRMLKERLIPLREAPVIALTATATPIVQDDIAHQLDMPNAERFIHGFRRTNIAVEVVELPERARSEATLRLLKQKGRRPAIVYAPTRKKAEALAADLAGSFPAAAYHAGMNPAIRERVQRDFLGGHLEVIVATIAFGMGIDKPDVRTVVHVALPGSMENYYQEIGRAGRDGKPSRAVLMYTYADVKTHEFFLDRDYPEPAVLARVYDRLTSEKQSMEKLVTLSGYDDEMLSCVLEKLWIHGGADVTPDDRVSRESGQWKRPYLEQRRHKEEQLRLMVAFAQSKTCRMLRLVRHFGDQEDSGEPCGQCDICAPTTASAKATRAASEAEQREMTALLKSLSLTTTSPKGKLYRDNFEDHLTRNEFESLVEGLFRSGLIRIHEDTFFKNGRHIEFQRLTITAKGYEALRKRGIVGADVQIAAVAPAKKRGVRKRTKPATKATGKPRAKATKKSASSTAVPSYRLVSELKAWRLGLAKKRGIPAFRILTDRVVNAIAADRPKTEDDLLAISGVGETILKKYGKQILAICLRVG